MGVNGKMFSSNYQPKKRRGKSAKTVLKKIFEDDPDSLEEIIHAQIKKAKKGDSTAFKLLSEILDGKPTQRIENEAETMEKPPRTVFIDFDKRRKEAETENKAKN